MTKNIIDAAPELLEAAKAFVRMCEMSGWSIAPDSPAGKAKAAIAKATVPDSDEVEAQDTPAGGGLTDEAKLINIALGLMDAPPGANLIFEVAKLVALAASPVPLSSDKSEAELTQALEERDRYHEMADDLAAQIASITGDEIGEHSSANDPWRNAMLAADDFIAAQIRKMLLPLSDTGAQEVPIAVLRRAFLASDGTLPDLIGHFCNEWNASIASPPPQSAPQDAAAISNPLDALRWGANVAETLLGIGKAIGFGRAQQILGEQWEAEHDCAPRGRMGVTVKDSAPQRPTQQALSDAQRRVLDFLYGVGELEGCGFSEKPAGELGNFWWRKHLRSAFPDILAAAGGKQ